MEFVVSDSSGTDDDLPPSHQNRFLMGGRTTPNVRSAVAGTGQFSRTHNDMETQIHHIEQEAYTSVLRAFKAQSDAITWDKEGLITELRKELRVSDEEHRELLSRVNADDTIRRIRDWRKANGLQPVHDPITSNTVSASMKKQKISQSVASLSAGAPSSALNPPFQPSSSALKEGPVSGARGKKTKSISPEDILWDGGLGCPGRGSKKSMARGGAGRGMAKGQLKKDIPPAKNGIGKKTLGDIEILQTNALIKQAEKVFNASHLAPLEVEKARKVLKEHEQALVDAIAMLEDVSDSESDGEHQGKTIDQERVRKQKNDLTEGEVKMVQGTDGNKMAQDGI